MCNQTINNKKVAMRLSHGMVVAFCMLVISSGCGMTSKVPRIGPVRAIWVTRWDYRTADDVKKIVHNCGSLGMNTILFQVRGNGTVFYPLCIEPWAEEFDWNRLSIRRENAWPVSRSYWQKPSGQPAGLG